MTSPEFRPRVRREVTGLAYSLLLACEGKAAEKAFLSDAAPLDMRLEWLLFGEGKSISTPENIETTLLQLFGEGAHDGERGLEMAATDPRWGVVQMLLKVREKLTSEMVTTPDIDSEPQDPKRTFDLAMRFARGKPLRRLSPTVLLRQRGRPPPSIGPCRS